MDGQLLQFVGSLIAIFLLAGLARLLGLGGKPRLKTAQQVQRAAGEVFDGFAVESFALDADGASAILRDQQGAIMVIKRHGNQFAGRLLDARANITSDGPNLVVDPGDARFGTVSLHLDDPAPWADLVNQLPSASHG